jgi:hypothetical protein
MRWFRTSTGTYTRRKQSPGFRTTELQMLESHSNDNLILNVPVPTRKPSLEHTELKSAVTKPASLQHYKERFSGWRVAVLNFAIGASVVFMLNLVVTIWGSVNYQKSQGILSTGDCGRIKSLNSGLHALINILSTILLSGSSYCMQCLSAPTRAEIDRAHATQRWLDIGVPSFRNIWHIKRKRAILWILLVVSSVPLHLL